MQKTFCICKNKRRLGRVPFATNSFTFAAFPLTSKFRPDTAPSHLLTGVRYVQDILTKTKADQVTIEPDGKWTQISEDKKNQNGTNGTSPGDEDSDDLVEMPSYRTRASTLKTESANTPVFFSTPPVSATSREASTAGSGAVPRIGSKRKSEVIDLTLSDDDEPAWPTKRPAYGPPLASITHDFLASANHHNQRYPSTSSTSVPTHGIQPFQLRASHPSHTPSSGASSHLYPPHPHDKPSSTPGRAQGYTPLPPAQQHAPSDQRQRLNLLANGHSLAR